MNSVIISGTIKNIVYKLVDRGNIYALIILKLEVEKCKKNIEIIGKNRLADDIYRKYSVMDNVIINGYLRKIKDNMIIIVKDIEKILKRYKRFVGKWQNG